MKTIAHNINLTDGRFIAALEQGSADGKPVVYLHGVLSSYRDRSGFEELYQQQGLRLISINRPGTGSSSASKDWTPLSFADDLLQLVNQLGIDKATVIGFSAGGLYGCAFAYSYPERVERLVLLSSSGPYDNPQLYDKLNDTTRSFYDAAKHNPEELLQQLSGVTTPGAMYDLLESIVSPEDKQVIGLSQVRERLLATFAEVLTQGMEASVKEVFNVASPWGFSPAQITVNTQLWHGTADQNVPIECCEYLAKEIPSATATYVEGAGHYFSFEQWPELLQEVSSNQSIISARTGT